MKQVLTKHYSFEKSWTGSQPPKTTACTCASRDIYNLLTVVLCKHSSKRPLSDLQVFCQLSFGLWWKSNSRVDFGRVCLFPYRPVALTCRCSHLLTTKLQSAFSYLSLSEAFSLKAPSPFPHLSLDFLQSVLSLTLHYIGIEIEGFFLLSLTSKCILKAKLVHVCNEVDFNETLIDPEQRPWSNGVSICLAAVTLFEENMLILRFSYRSVKKLLIKCSLFTKKQNKRKRNGLLLMHLLLFQTLWMRPL